MGRGAGATAAIGLLLAAAPAAGDPRVDYQLECQGCHRPDGSGSPGAVPDLRGSIGRFLSVPGGREFLVQVPGSAWSPLDDARLAALLDWMIVRFGPPEVAADFRRYSAEEVARYRAAPLVDVAAVRRRLLARIEARAEGDAAPAP